MLTFRTITHSHIQFELDHHFGFFFSSPPLDVENITILVVVNVFGHEMKVLIYTNDQGEWRRHIVVVAIPSHLLDVAMLFHDGRLFCLDLVFNLLQYPKLSDYEYIRIGFYMDHELID